MNSFLLKRLSLLLLGTLLLQAPHIVCAAGVTVEQVMRDFQVRHKLVNDTYLQWPACNPSSQTPAPQFPKDGFYGDILLDSDKGVQLVQDLVTKFYTDNIIYSKFVYAPNGESDLEGATEIRNYTLGDVAPIIIPGDVNADNYMQKLQDLASILLKLKYVKVGASQVDLTSKATRRRDLSWFGNPN